MACKAIGYRSLAGGIRPGQTVGGQYVVHLLDTAELVLLELLYRLAARGAEAKGDIPLMRECLLDAAELQAHLTQRARLATGGVSGNA